MLRLGTCECRMHSPSATLDGKSIRAGRVDRWGAGVASDDLTLAVGPLSPWTVLDKAEVGGETLL